MMTFSPLRLREIRDAILSGSGREIDRVARAFGPLRAPMDPFFALVPVETTEDPGLFGVALETCGYRHTQHIGLDAFRAAGVSTDGLPESGVFIAAPLGQPA